MAAVSSLILTVPMMNQWIPMPFYLVVLAWISVLAFPLATPVLYILYSTLAAKSKHFSMITVGLVVLIAALNTFYFSATWHYGVQYQGAPHTRIVALENVVGFLAVLSLSIWAHSKQSRSMVYAASLLLFFLMSWCAFPYLGEAP